MSKRNAKRHRRYFRRQTPPGAPAGIVAVDPAAKPPRIQVICYGPQAFEERTDVRADQLREFVGRYPVMWVNIDGLGDAATIETVGRVFGLHRLALEDVVNVHQRAKVDRYGEQLFIVTRAPSNHARFESEQISYFVFTGVVITFQEEEGDCWQPLRERLRAPTGRLRTLGADFLAYALIDATIDSYYPVLDGCEERLDRLDETITMGLRKGSIAEIHAIRYDLRHLRRAIAPHRDAINQLLREPSHDFSDETRIHLRDCYDHVIQIIDAIDVYREMCTDLREFYLSKVSVRVNDVMKVLTIIATIFIPLTFIVGVYGMNFDTSVSPWNMPELKWRYGYPAVCAVMIVIAAMMVVFFYRKGWIGGDGDAISGP